MPWCELPTDYTPQEFRVQWASGPWMHDEAHALRRRVFCSEQRLFEDDDRDAIDTDNPSTRLLVALACVAGHPDAVVGTVRIHEAEPGVWWGSRLAVASAWRRHSRLGSTLIQLAVSSAHALGCREFLAHVQVQNVPLFLRLHWTRLGPRILHGWEHAAMQADLAHYPPCTTPLAGYVVAGGSSH